MNSQKEQTSDVQYELLSKLPTEITIDILSRLPVGDLSSCRLLSKAWYHLINSPNFVTLQHNKLMKTHSPCVFLHLRPKSEARPGCYSFIGRHKSLGSNVTLLTPNFPLHLDRIRNIYSSNGLILVEAYSESTTRFIKLSSCFYVCNPITGEHNQIPEPYWPDAQTRFIFDVRFSGDSDVPEPYWAHSQTRFIFDPVTRVFKIVRINFNVIQVYSSRVGEWRTIEKATFRAPPTDVLQDVFNNGALHWLGSSLEAPPSITDTIISLRFDTEEFKLIPLPNGLDLSILKKDCCYLVVLGDCLSLATEVGDEHVEIWVMKEYGLQSSWDKKYIIEDMTIYRAITLMPNGEILTVSSRGEFGFYNHETNVFRSTNFWVDIFREVSFTVISLISPCAGSVVNLLK